MRMKSNSSGATRWLWHSIRFPAIATTVLTGLGGAVQLQSDTADCVVDGCPINKAAEQNGVCEPNVCECDHGAPASAEACWRPGGNQCDPTGCTDGYHYKVSSVSIIGACGQKDIGTCMENVCTCTNGTAVVAPDCGTDGDNSCSECHTGFHLDAITADHCEPNVCTCPNGSEASGADCTADNEMICVKCDDGFSLTDGSCVQNTCSCEYGNLDPDQTKCTQDGAQLCLDCTEAFYHLEGSSCVPNVCICTNGEPVDECENHNSTACASCAAGFHDEVASEATGSDPATKQCTANTCTCDNGTPQVTDADSGSICAGHNTEQCAECANTFSLDGDLCVRIPVNCEVTEFAEWADVTCRNAAGNEVTCGVGKQTRERTIITPAAGTGTPCPASASLTEEKDCFITACEYEVQSTGGEVSGFLGTGSECDEATKLSVCLPTDSSSQVCLVKALEVYGTLYDYTPGTPGECATYGYIGIDTADQEAVLGHLDSACLSTAAGSTATGFLQAPNMNLRAMFAKSIASKKAMTLSREKIIGQPHQRDVINMHDAVAGASGGVVMVKQQRSSLAKKNQNRPAPEKRQTTATKLKRKEGEDGPAASLGVEFLKDTLSHVAHATPGTGPAIGGSKKKINKERPTPRTGVALLKDTLSHLTSGTTGAAIGGRRSKKKINREPTSRSKAGVALLKDTLSRLTPGTGAATAAGSKKKNEKMRERKKRPKRKQVQHGESPAAKTPLLALPHLDVARHGKSTGSSHIKVRHGQDGLLQGKRNKHEEAAARGTSADKSDVEIADDSASTTTTSTTTEADDVFSGGASSGYATLTSYRAKFCEQTCSELPDCKYFSYSLEYDLCGFFGAGCSVVRGGEGAGAEATVSKFDLWKKLENQN